MGLLDSVLPPMNREGRKFVAIFVAVTIVAFLICPFLGWIALGLTVWCYYFFRDPVRTVPDNKGLILSPADGVVSQIGPAIPPEGLGMAPEPLTRIAIFMSVFNCHVNRSPADGTVGAVVYRPGRFVSASLDKASDENERNAIRLDLRDGGQLAVVQIAGLVARRIVCWAKPGLVLRKGERFGLIRFGSRLDVYLPPGVEPLVAVGQTMVAGESVIADLEGRRPALALRKD